MSDQTTTRRLGIAIGICHVCRDTVIVDLDAAVAIADVLPFEETPWFTVLPPGTGSLRGAGIRSAAVAARTAERPAVVILDGNVVGAVVALRMDLGGVAERPDYPIDDILPIARTLKVKVNDDISIAESFFKRIDEESVERRPPKRNLADWRRAMKAGR